MVGVLVQGKVLVSSILTVDANYDSLADTWRHRVGRDAQIRAHIV